MLTLVDRFTSDIDLTEAMSSLFDLTRAMGWWLGQGLELRCDESLAILQTRKSLGRAGGEGSRVTIVLTAWYDTFVGSSCCTLDAGKRSSSDIKLPTMCHPM